jgi:hypothetical protein
MKIFISYKQSWVSDIELKDKLSQLRVFLEKLGHENYIFYFDNDLIEKTPQDIIRIAKNEIEKADVVIAFVNYSWKSEWMLLELWIAHGLNKKIMFLLNQELDDEYYLTYWISNNTVLFNNFTDIESILKNELPHK